MSARTTMTCVVGGGFWYAPLLGRLVFHRFDGSPKDQTMTLKCW